jgi:hypothetical protein
MAAKDISVKKRGADKPAITQGLKVISVTPCRTAATLIAEGASIRNENG